MFSCITHGTSTSISLSDEELTVSDINSLNSSALDNLDFVYLAACSTGMGGDSGNNLVNAIYNKNNGVTVLGFNHEVEQTETNYWTTAFMESLSEGSTVAEAMTDADMDVEIYYSSSGEICKYTTTQQHRHFKGDITITPCR